MKSTFACFLSLVLTGAGPFTVSTQAGAVPPIRLPANLILTSPPTRSTFEAPATIALKARAVDPDGYISRVEFYAGVNLIGVSAITFIRAPDPGTPIDHSFLWEDVQPGVYWVTAQAQTSSGHHVISQPILITVTPPESTRTVITVTATVAETSEPAGTSTAQPGVFTVHRSGNLETPIQVAYRLSGSARNGIDYQRLSGEITVPANAETAEVLVSPLPDSEIEGLESVVLTIQPPICAQIIPIPPACYQVGEPATAKITIADAGAPAARLTITHPKEGATFAPESTIPVQVEAVDPAGVITRAELYANDERVGVVQIYFFVPPAPGTPTQFEFEWKGAPSGDYALTARAQDARQNLVVSDAVHIRVGESTTPSPIVVRYLPPSYTPGQPVEVRLEATPPADTAVYAVEDRPPTDWNVVPKISDNGVWDQANHKVKFGPFLDGRPRTLLYQVIPPITALGLHHFSGTVSLDGNNIPVEGDKSIDTTPLHPADDNPADYHLTIAEVTTYAWAWKTGKPWPRQPSPIPIDYVTRAGALWRGGETYAYDPHAGPLPAGWVNTSLDTQPIPPPSPLVETSATTESASATAAMPRVYVPGTPIAVTLTVHPAPGVQTYAVEERVPFAWLVTSVGQEGVVSGGNRPVLRWGPFFDNQTRHLTYKVVPPVTASRIAFFAGAVSFDGRNKVPLSGQRNCTLEGSPPPDILWFQKPSQGGIRLQLHGRLGVRYDVQRSNDLVRWTSRGSVKLTSDPMPFVDSTGGNGLAGFYRLRPISTLEQ